MTLDEFLRALETLIDEQAQDDDPGEGNFGCEDCRACYSCRFCVGCDSCEDCTYCEESLECTSCTQSKRCVGCEKVSYCEDCRDCKASRYLTLCVDCTDCVHCLACVGLQGAEFYVLNQKCSRKEYFALLRQVQELVKQRLESGWRPNMIGLASDILDLAAAGRDAELTSSPWLDERELPRAQAAVVRERGAEPASAHVDALGRVPARDRWSDDELREPAMPTRAVRPERSLTRFAEELEIDDELALDDRYDDRYDEPDGYGEYGDSPTIARARGRDGWDESDVPVRGEQLPTQPFGPDGPTKPFSAAGGLARPASARSQSPDPRASQASQATRSTARAESTRPRMPARPPEPPDPPEQDRPRSRERWEDSHAETAARAEGASTSGVRRRIEDTPGRDPSTSGVRRRYEDTGSRDASTSGVRRRIEEPARPAPAPAATAPGRGKPVDPWIDDEDVPESQDREPSSPWLDDEASRNRRAKRASLRSAGRPRRKPDSGPEASVSSTGTYRTGKAPQQRGDSGRDEGTRTGLRMGRRPKRG